MSQTNLIFESDFVFPTTTNQGRSPLNNHLLSMTEPVLRGVASGYVPERAISDHLRDNGQSITWLAKKVGLSRSYLHNMLKSPPPYKQPLPEAVRQKINEVLKTNY